MQILIDVIVAFGAYLLGSVSPALIISRSVEKKDIRECVMLVQQIWFAILVGYLVLQHLF